MREFKVVRRFFCIIAALVMLLTGVEAVHAATITVTANAADVLNGANGSCALREAIQNINNAATTYADCANTGAAYGTSDTIVLPAGTYTNTIAGTGEDLNATGDLDILVSVTISGAGAGSSIIDGGAIDRVIHIGGVTVSINGITIQNGSVASNGGGILAGAGTLTITNSTISGNAITAAGIVYGGGLYITGGVLNVSNSTFSGNTADFVVGAGAAMVINASTATITNSTISGNSGVLAGINVSGGSSLTLTGSTLSGNSGNSQSALSVANGNTATITNSTIANNTIAGAGNGAITNSGTVTIKNTTIYGNQPYGLKASGGTFTISNSIVTGNTTADCSNFAGAINSSGYNLDSDNSCNLIQATDIPNSALANLAALANNGGSTQTMALQAGSAAIDAGDCSAGAVTTDQRGYSRPSGSACDIGAYEYPVYTVTPSAGANGTINPNTPQSINHGSTTAFTVTPNAGYTALVGGTCGGNLVGTTYTTNAITANCTVSASFAAIPPNTYIVTPSAGAGGTIAPNTPQSINHGSTTAFTVTPNAGYTASVGGTCGGNLVGTTYTTNAITANCTVTASFTLTCSYSISPTSLSFDLSGGTGTVTVTAPGGCAWTAASYTSWTSITSGSSGSGDGTVSFTIASNSGASRTGSLTIAGHSFTITQAGVQYSLVVTKSGTGTGTVNKLYAPGGMSFSMFSQLLCGPECQVAIMKYDIGTQVSLYAVPETGATFNGWTGTTGGADAGGCSGPGVCTVTLNGDTSVNAAFAPITAPITDKATSKLETIGNDIYVKTPIIRYVNPSNSTTYYNAEFIYMPTSDNKLWLKLTKADQLTDSSQYNGAQLSQLYQVGSDWRLHLTTIAYNGSSVWADLEYAPTNDGILWFAVTGSGEN